MMPRTSSSGISKPMAGQSPHDSMKPRCSTSRVSPRALYRRVEHPDSWRHVWRHKTVVGQALMRDERRVFQPFLLVSLLAFGMQVAIARL